MAMKLLSAAILVLFACTALATPEFVRAYREYKLTCMSCHTQPPKLNAYGEQFARNGYRIPGAKRAQTIPASVWASGQMANSDTQPGTWRSVPNRVEVISAGGDEGFSYFAEWRVLSKELLGDGSYRDRSGRFEDLFVVVAAGKGARVQVGQFRAMAQIDVSRRLFLSEPAAFSTALAGEPDPDARISSLRGFSLAGRAPGVRALFDGAGWSAAVTVPFPGEVSIPLTKEAQDTASMEFEGTPKGVLAEAWLADGQDTVGVQAFVGRNERTLLGLAAQRRTGDVWLEGGVSRAEVQGESEWRYTVSADWIPRAETAFGLRLDHRQVAGQTVSLTPYVSLFRGRGAQAGRLTLEGKFQDGRTPRFALEAGWFF
jgi:hypothetical protein